MINRSLLRTVFISLFTPLLLVFSNSTANADAYSSAVLADAPRAYWRLDETSGTTLADLSGRNHPAHIGTADFTLNQPSLLASSPSDGALKSLGASTTPACTVAASTDFDVTTAVTLETWMKATGYNNGLLGRARYYLGTDAGNPYLFIRAGGTGYSCSATTVNVLDGVRHHIVGTYNGSL